MKLAPRYQAPLFFAAVLAGCSGGPMSASEVRAGLSSPTGSIRSKPTLASANAKRTLSMNALGTASLGSASLALQETGAALRSGSQAEVIRRISRLLPSAALGKQSQALGEASSTGSCDEALRAAMNNVSASGTSAHYSGSINFSECAPSILAGSLEVSGDAEANLGTGTIRVVMTERFNNVCVLASNTCVDGDFMAEMAGSGRSMTVTGSWDIRYTAPGLTAPLHMEGGVEIQHDDSSQEFQVRQLVLTDDEDGSPVSLRFGISSNADFEIAGRDGKLRCALDASGPVIGGMNPPAGAIAPLSASGTICEGGFSWTQAEADAFLTKR